MEIFHTGQLTVTSQGMQYRGICIILHEYWDHLYSGRCLVVSVFAEHVARHNLPCSCCAKVAVPIFWFWGPFFDPNYQASQHFTVNHKWKLTVYKVWRVHAISPRATFRHQWAHFRLGRSHPRTERGPSNPPKILFTPDMTSLAALLWGS